MDRHVSNIFVKLGVTSRAAATAFAVEHDMPVRPPVPIPRRLAVWVVPRMRRARIPPSVVDGDRRRPVASDTTRGEP